MIHYCFFNNNPNTTSKTFLYYTKFLSLCLFLCLHTPTGPSGAEQPNLAHRNILGI